MAASAAPAVDASSIAADQLKSSERQEEEAILELYMQASGMV